METIQSSSFPIFRTNPVFLTPKPLRPSKVSIKPPPPDFDFRSEISVDSRATIARTHPELLDLAENGSLFLIKKSQFGPVPAWRAEFVEPEAIWLVGTNHISQDSAVEVERVVRAVKPDNVVVELCRSRAGIMYADASMDGEAGGQQLRSNMFSLSGTGFFGAVGRSINLGGQTALALRVLLAVFSSKISSDTNRPFGDEFRSARKASEEVGAQIVLGDRPIEITLERAWNSLTWSEKLSLVSSVVRGITSQSDMSKKNLNDELDRESSTSDSTFQLYKQLSSSYPSLLQPLIHERDTYLAWSLKRSKAVNKSKKVVGVIGKGHMNGVIYALLADLGDLRFRDLVGQRPTGTTDASSNGWIVKLVQDLIRDTVIAALLWALYEQFIKVSFQAMDATDSAEFRQSSSISKPSFVGMINILLVDDDATTLAIVSAMLKTWSYQVVAVKNPMDALAILRAQKGAFDLVVTDLHMPQMDGFELHKHVRNEFKLPVIMMSADDNENVILKSLEGGFADYMVKPVSKDDIKNVWQYAEAAKKGKSVVIEEIEGAPREAPGEVDNGSNSGMSSDTDEEQHGKKAEAKAKKSKKRNREGDNEERMVAPKKPKVVWTNSLHNQFLLAIRHIGLDKAVPKRILEFMNVPGLTRENVASHLQKYRMFLKRVAEKARLSKCLSERVFRSSFAFGHPGPVFNSMEAGDQYSQYLKLQQQMGASPINIASAFQPSSAGIDGNTINLLGSIQYPNYQQSSCSSNTMRSMPQLISSGQSRLLNHITQANLLRHQPWLGNVNHQLISQASRRPGVFGMQQLMNNFGSSGGMSSNAANTTGLTTNNIITNNLIQIFQQARQHGILTNNNPFSYNFGTPGIQNNVTNQQLIGNFSGTQIMSPNGRSELLGILNNFNGTGGFSSNGFNFNDETINGLTNRVRNVSLSGTTPPMATLGGSSSLSHSAGIGTSTTTSSAYQFRKDFSNNREDQLQNVSVLPPPAENTDDNSTTTPTLVNKNNLSPGQEMDKALDDLMISNLFVDQQNNYQPPPSSQQQGGDQDQLPPDFSSFLYPVEVPDATPNQMNPAVADRGLDTAVNKVSDPSPDQVPKPNSSGTYCVEENAPNEQSWSQQGGDQQVLNPEFSGNVFESEDYNMLFQTALPFPDCDDDFLNALLGDGL